MMAENFTGKVLFANGFPAQNVLVRVFDKDEPGKGDDDLTINPGRSDSEGKFTVRFEPSRYLDYNTIPTKEPVNLPWDLTLTTHTRRIPDLTDIYLPYLSSVGKAYGLCGGMSSAAYDFLLAGRSIPSDISTPTQGSPLHKYLYRRQVDTFGALGDYITKFAQWMVLPDDTILGIQKRTYDEFEAIHAKLDDGNAVVLGLIYVSGRDSWEIWNNHQALAYSYSEISATTIDINIYDPNYPQRDDVAIRLERVPVGTTLIPGVPPRKRTVLGFKCSQKIGEFDKNIRGFFAMPYVPIVPPSGL